MLKKYSALAVFLVFISGLVAVSSCDQTTSASFEDSFQKVKQVTPINGAQDVTMNLGMNSSDSFFSVSLDGKPMEGWCIEWSEDASFGLNEGTSLYSTKGQEAWKELNYFMAIKDDLRGQDPNLTYKEIQVVIWSLIDNPSFNVDNISTYENISERIYKEGEPQFDVQKVKNILNQVDHYFQNNTNESSWWWSNLFLILIQNDGQTVMTTSGALSYVAFDTGCSGEVTSYSTGSTFEYTVETNYKQTEGTIKFEAEGDQLGEDGVKETDTFEFTIACETSEITVETKNRDTDTHTFEPGEVHNMSNGFTVEWVDRTNNEDGTFTYIFTVTSDAI